MVAARAMVAIAVAPSIPVPQGMSPPLEQTGPAGSRVKAGILVVMEGPSLAKVTDSGLNPTIYQVFIGTNYS